MSFSCLPVWLCVLLNVWCQVFTGACCVVSVWDCSCACYPSAHSLIQLASGFDPDTCCGSVWRLCWTCICILQIRRIHAMSGTNEQKNQVFYAVVPQALCRPFIVLLWFFGAIYFLAFSVRVLHLAMTRWAVCAWELEENKQVEYNRRSVTLTAGPGPAQGCETRSRI